VENSEVLVKKGIKMTIEQLIEMTQNRLTILNEQKIQYTKLGDVSKVTELDTEIFKTETTLNKLKSLQV
jgi:hypothetical protein